MMWCFTLEIVNFSFFNKILLNKLKKGSIVAYQYQYENILNPLIDKTKQIAYIYVY